MYSIPSMKNNIEWTNGPPALFNLKPLLIHTSMENRKNKQNKTIQQKNRKQKGSGTIYTNDL